MIIPDANLLLYAFDVRSLWHVEARKWLESAFAGPELIGLPWQSVYAFLRIATDPRIAGMQCPMGLAVEVVQGWLRQPKVRMLNPGERHWRLLQEMLVEGQVKGPMVTDAQLAALTMEYGGVLYTNDRDFARFPGCAGSIRWLGNKRCADSRSG
jgi:hypothetical protein